MLGNLPPFVAILRPPSTSGSGSQVIPVQTGAAPLHAPSVPQVLTAAPLSAAGRLLFAEPGQRKHSDNDADRHTKYLARPGLDWANLEGANLDWANLAGSALPATADVRGCMVRKVARVFGNLQASP